MAQVSPFSNATDLRAPDGRGAFVNRAYWLVVLALLAATALGAPLAQPAEVTAATVLMIGGGLPHGAYDIALLRRATVLDRYRLVLAVGGYAAIVALMGLMWIAAPLLALILFLAVSAYHFGEDWPMLDVPLLRFAAGAAVIAASTIGHPAQVAALFVAMSDPRAVIIAKIIMAAAPVTLLVTAVGVVAAWRNGSRQWAVAMAVCLGLLVLLPPVAGFALFFVFLHAPRHIKQARAALRDMDQKRWLATGALVSGVAVVGWWALQRLAPWQIDETVAAHAFQLLASVAVPHLALSRWLEKRLEQSQSAPHHSTLAKASA